MLLVLYRLRHIYALCESKKASEQFLLLLRYIQHLRFLLVTTLSLFLFGEFLKDLLVGFALVHQPKNLSFEVFVFLSDLTFVALQDGFLSLLEPLQLRGLGLINGLG